MIGFILPLVAAVLGACDFLRRWTMAAAGALLLYRAIKRNP